MRAKRTAAALYARVSTKDRQETENQLQQLRQFARCQHWIISGEYVDKASGATDERAEFRRLFEDAARGQFDVVLFWSLDRFSREGARRTLEHLNRLETHGVRFRSYTQEFFDTAGPFREALISILAALAQQERNQLRERVTAGMERARRAGVLLGRRPRAIDAQVLKSLQNEGLSLSAIAAKTGISKATVFRRIEAYERSQIQQ